MTRIDRDVVHHLEKLARIDLKPEEVDTITEQLSRIVTLVEALQKVDVTGIEPTQGIAHEAAGPLRADVVTPGLDRATVLAEAPDATKEFFRVPRVLGRGDES